jgi:hypothetical protein
VVDVTPASIVSCPVRTGRVLAGNRIMCLVPLKYGQLRRRMCLIELQDVGPGYSAADEQDIMAIEVDVFVGIVNLRAHRSYPAIPAGCRRTAGLCKHCKLLEADQRRCKWYFTHTVANL